MIDRDELLARVDNFTPTTDQDAEIIEALRAALAARPQPDEVERLREFVAAHDAVVEELITDFTDDRDAYNAAIQRFDRVRAAVAGSATPTDYDDNGWETLRHDIPEEET